MTQQPHPSEFIQIDNTTYIIHSHFAEDGLGISEKIKSLLDRETSENLTFSLPCDTIEVSRKPLRRLPRKEVQ